MSKLYTNFLIFSLGVALAFLFAFRGHLGSGIQNLFDSGDDHLELVINTTPDEFARARLSERQMQLEQTEQKRARFREKLTKEKRLEVIVNAVVEGTPDSLELIRMEYLGFLPDYREILLPALKEAGLSELRKRFEESDWLDWPSTTREVATRSTQARQYVDRIRLVNPELGRFLETAAQLFHGMYLSTLSGNIYEPSEDLYYVIHNAERLLAQRTSPAVPARLLLDPSILSDQAFLNASENLRCDLVVLYIHRQPNELERHLGLLSAVTPRHCSPSVSVEVRKLLRRLTLEVSQIMRLNLIDSVTQSSALQEFANLDRQIKRLLAEFYLVAAVDFLETGDFNRAEQMLQSSKELLTGLESQIVVQNYLNSARAAANELASAESIIPPAPQSERFGATRQVVSSINWATLLVNIVLIAIAGTTAVILFLWMLRRRETRRSTTNVEDDDRSSSDNVIDLTSPDDLSFEDIFDLEDEPKSARH